MDYGLPRWMDPMDIFGYSHKTMDDMGAGIVKRATTASGSTRQGKIPFPRTKSKSLMRGSFNSKRERDDFDESQRAAQILRSGFSQTKTKRRRKSDIKMGKYAPGTLGRKYKPNFKQVKIGPRTSRLRYVDHSEVTGTNAVYAAFNDVGPLDHLLRSVAEATLLYYMSKAGDHRPNQYDPVVGISDQLVTPSGLDDHQTTWGKMVFKWRRRSGGTTITTENVGQDVLYHHGDNTVAAGTINSFATMAENLTTIFKARSETYDLASVTIFEARGTLYNHDGGQQQRPTYHDPDAGRHKMMFTAKAKFKIQNTTLADTTTDQANKDNIHANPLDGLVYKFRNRVPQWAPGFIGALPETTANILNNIENIQTSAVNGVECPSLANYEWFKVPPPAPYTLFKNSAGRSKILIKPGEHRVIKLSEDFEGSINSFFKKYCSVYPDSRVVPPGGNCIVIGLKPTFRTGTNEDLEIQTEIDRYFQSVLVPRKLTPMPITNVLS